MRDYGDAMKALWPLEKGMIFLNHGSYGATPKAVLAEQARWRERLEAQPCRFINTEAPREIRAAAGRLATFLGARPEDVGFVENTTAGINAVLKSLRFEPGDEVVVTDHIYNAVNKTLGFVLAPQGARVVRAELGLPLVGDPVAAVMAAVTPSTRLILVDHVASISAVKLPVAEIAAAARSRGVPVLIDGAHAPGMVELDIPALGADWYVGNCHKWLCAPKGSAFVWAPEARQEGLHPTVISHDLDQGFTAEFDKIGTRDATAWLSVPAAIAFHEEAGGAALRARNHAVAVDAARALAARWGTEMGADEEQFGSMATVRLPTDQPAERETSERLKAWAWATHRAEIHVMPFAGTFWTRISVQAYNTAEECAAVGPILEEGLAAL
ncbi:MAG: aminotransferase class V-fold PLP-dependent enzyme [Pseudomonadota bacterium]